MEDDNEKFIKEEEKEKGRGEINEKKENNENQNGEDENNNLLPKNDIVNNEASIGLKNGNNEEDKNNIVNNVNDNIENKIDNDNIEEDKNPLIKKDNENIIKNGNNIENNENDLIIGDYIITIQYTKLFHIPYFKFGNMLNFYCPCYKFKSPEINLSQMPTPPFGIVTNQCKIYF